MIAAPASAPPIFISDTNDNRLRLMREGLTDGITFDPAKEILLDAIPYQTEDLSASMSLLVRRHHGALTDCINAVAARSLSCRWACT